MSLPQPPRVALIGRTNVGKSSLFNRMVEEQKSLVSDIAGTTRDRFYADCLWRAKIIRLIDTGGLDVDVSQEIERNVVKQAELAMKEADIIAFVVDARIGPTPEDLELARRLVSSPKPVIVLGNKADTAETRAGVNGDLWRTWPLSRPIALSAKQGTGVGDALDVMSDILEKQGTPAVPVSSVSPMRVVVLGQPNVGKSTLLNGLVGEERFIAANIPHTTREPNDVLIEHEGHLYKFIDTAGVRRQASRRKSGTQLENKGVDKTLEIVSRGDVALFVLDVNTGITVQDKHLAGKLAESGVSTVIVVNKWDLIGDKTPTTINDFEKKIRAHLPQLDYAPVVFISAKNGQRVRELYKAITHVYNSRFTQLSDDEARQFLARAIMKHRPQRGKGVKHPQIIRFEQTKVNPPVFTLAINLPREEALNVAYVRFLEGLLRQYYDFTGTPLFMRIESKQAKSHTTY